MILVFGDVQKGGRRSQIIEKELSIVLVYRFAIKSLRGSLDWFKFSVGFSRWAFLILVAFMYSEGIAGTVSNNCQSSCC